MNKKTYSWQPIDTAPKDRPITVWCKHSTETDTVYDKLCKECCEASDGVQVVEWGRFPDTANSTYREVKYLEWWGLADNERYTPANPVMWIDLDEPDMAEGTASHEPENRG